MCSRTFPVFIMFLAIALHSMLTVNLFVYYYNLVSISPAPRIQNIICVILVVSCWFLSFVLGFLVWNRGLILTLSFFYKIVSFLLLIVSGAALAFSQFPTEVGPYILLSSGESHKAIRFFGFSLFYCLGALALAYVLQMLKDYLKAKSEENKDQKKKRSLDESEYWS